MRKLKIAMYFPYNAARAGGVQEHVYHLAKTLATWGHAVTVYGTPHPVLPYINYKAIGTTYDVPAPTGNLTNLHLVSNTGVEHLVSEIDRTYDIVHIHDPFVPFLAWELIKRLKTPEIVVTYHFAWDKSSSLNFATGIMPLFRGFFSGRVSGTIYVSQTARRCWHALSSGQKVVEQIIFNGIDHQEFRPKNQLKSHSKTKLLFVGSLTQRKGAVYLLEAFRLLAKLNPEVKLTIVGDGQERKKLEMLAKTISTNIEFTGQLTGKSKIAAYQNADIFCAPYKDEAFPLTILEALATGLPVAGFMNDSFAESLKNYPAKQLLVPQGDVKLLAQAIMELCQDAHLRQNLSSWCLRESRKYSWEKTCSMVLEAYQRVLKI